MRDTDILQIASKTGKSEADIAALQKDGQEMDVRIEIIEKYVALQKLTIAKCTAIWGFIIAFVTTVGGFVAYNFVKVKLAVVAAFTVFYEGK